MMLAIEGIAIKPEFFLRLWMGFQPVTFALPDCSQCDALPTEPLKPHVGSCEVIYTMSSNTL